MTSEKGEKMKMTVFDELQAVNVNGHTEKKKTGNTELTYLSWPWAWAEVKKRYPSAHYEIIRDDTGRAYFGEPDTGYMVYTQVTIEGITHDMWLPVMDGANKAMKKEPYTYRVKNPAHKWAKMSNDGKYYDKYGKEQPEYLEKMVDAMTAFDVNKTIMRCLVKNLAMFGLGLYIYAGEDLPMVEETKHDAEPAIAQQEPEPEPEPTPEETMPAPEAPVDPDAPITADDWKVLQKTIRSYGVKPLDVLQYYGLQKASQISNGLYNIIVTDLPAASEIIKAAYDEQQAEG